MKTLILMRHAKSDWTHQDLNDHDRPLNPRGMEAAERMAVYFREQGLKPDRILCSTARRARETWTLMSGAFTVPPMVTYDEHLYMASATRMLKIIQALPDDVQTAMIIGHNPGLHALALALAIAAKDDQGLHPHLVAKLPTGSAVILRFDASAWRAINPGRGELVDFARPKSLISTAA